MATPDAAVRSGTKVTNFKRSQGFNICPLGFVSLFTVTPAIHGFVPCAYVRIYDKYNRRYSDPS
jgi:hypothetical protein